MPSPKTQPMREMKGRGGEGKLAALRAQWGEVITISILKSEVNSDVA